MPLNKRRNIIGSMDVKIYIQLPATTVSDTGGPVKSYTEKGPYWSAMEYLSRKQMETEVATRITSFQQVMFTTRDEGTKEADLKKAGFITLATNAAGVPQYNIISVSKDTGRDQYLVIITELKE